MAVSSAAEASVEFWGAYSDAQRYREYKEKDEERLRNSLPEVMRMILRRDGWCSYNQQVLWLCDPDDWKVVANAWFPGEPAAQVLARSAFGDLFVLSGTFWLAFPHMSWILQGSLNPNFFFGQAITAKDFLTRAKKEVPAKVAAARKVAGPLEWDEMYTYEPALALGGTEKKSKIRRVKAREQLVLLSQLAPIDR